MNNPYQNSQQQITPEKLQEMLVVALTTGNEPLYQEILHQGQRISELEIAHRTTPENLAMFLRELKNTLNTKQSSNGLKKQLRLLTEALNKWSERQEELTASIDSLNEKLGAEPDLDS